jgi:N-formylmaleamate deformylase
VRPIVIGHSMGAATAAELAARFSDRVGALVLEDPPWRPLPETPALARVTPGNVERVTSAAHPASPPLAQWIASLEGLTVEEVMGQNRIEHPAWPDEVLRRWSEAKLQLDRAFLFREAAHPMAWPEIVDAIRCPTLLITSDPDRGGIMTPSLVQEVTSRNQSFEWVLIDGVGHHIRFEAYTRYREAVMAFLSRVCEG